MPQAPIVNHRYTTSRALHLAGRSNGGAEATCLQYIGLQGDHTHDKRKAVHAVYELNCVHKDTGVQGDLGAAEGV